MQRVIEVMKDHGLEPMRYAFICFDEWEAVDPITDDEGNEIAPGTVAGDIYSLRMDQLALFVARGQAARLDAIEAAIASGS